MINIQAIADTYNLRRTGDRYTGPCPKCGGSAKSDKFQIRADGGFKCYACDFKGDIITWLREMDGLSCPEAFTAAGIPCTSHSCSVRGTCRHGDGTGQPRKKQPTSASVPTRHNSRVPTTQQRDPQNTWRTWAERLAAKAQATLTTNSEALDWLKQRGIPADAAQQHGLGWLDHPHKINRASIGLPPVKNDKDTLWIPAGLLIVTRDLHGTIHRLRVRRTDADREKFRPDLKYVWIEGSGNAPLMINRPQAQGTIIVEAELDAIACAAASDQVNIIALGTVNMPPTAEQHQDLVKAPVILVALDADAGTKDKPGAGIAAYKQNWQPHYRQATYWPVPSGKDPGEYAKQGGNLALWITAGLPKPPRAKVPAPLSRPIGGSGEEEPSIPSHISGRTLNGYQYVVADDPADVPELQRHFPEATVFTPEEIRPLCGMTREQAETMLLVKREFRAKIESTGPISTPEPQKTVQPMQGQGQTETTPKQGEFFAGGTP